MPFASVAEDFPCSALTPEETSPPSMIAAPDSAALRYTLWEKGSARPVLALQPLYLLSSVMTELRQARGARAYLASPPGERAAPRAAESALDAREALRYRP